VNYVETVDDRVRVRNVVISVFDKRGLEELVPAFLRINPEVRFYSTGGSYRRLEEILGGGPDAAGSGASAGPGTRAERLVSVSDYTGQPEMQGGLVKTLDFKIYLGLLSETYNEEHARDLERTGAVTFDMVVVNLYPFAQTVAQPDATPEQARANIDIGGPCMIRAAAKNFIRVAPVVDPDDYAGVVRELEAAGGTLSLATRFRLARKAFAHTAQYDAAIAAYLGEREVGEVEGSYREIRQQEERA
jgi:phosphoribosylaminoimidazolecarboxamide formyltransferase/IMP cyclohydrolase